MNRPRTKGTAFETLVLEGFREQWPDAHRLGLQGCIDKGDIWLPAETNLTVEVKCETAYTGKLSTWLAQAHIEAANAGRDLSVVVHKRYGKKSWPEQYVTTDLRTLLQLMGRR